ncbi:MAG: hypothetical protein MHPSP_001048 [Paramarteilia canceri]
MQIFSLNDSYVKQNIGIICWSATFVKNATDLEKVAYQFYMIIDEHFKNLCLDNPIALVGDKTYKKVFGEPNYDKVLDYMAAICEFYQVPFDKSVLGKPDITEAPSVMSLNTVFDKYYDQTLIHESTDGYGFATNDNESGDYVNYDEAFAKVKNDDQKFTILSEQTCEIKSCPNSNLESGVDVREAKSVDTQHKVQNNNIDPNNIQKNYGGNSEPENKPESIVNIASFPNDQNNKVHQSRISPPKQSFQNNPGQGLEDIDDLMEKIRKKNQNV